MQAVTISLGSLAFGYNIGVFTSAKDPVSISLE